ncbi:MAG: DJ-1 family glyoxalase III [Candidatus Aenigmatarchaeota archaeon]
MKRVLVPLAEGFEELEAMAAIDVLKRAGIDVIVAGLPGTIVKGRSGVKVVTDKRVDEIDQKSLDGIVLPGGNPGYINLGKSKKIIEIINDLDKSKKMIAAICASPSILAKLGILDERRATIYPGMERDVPRPRPANVVTDGHIITSQGPGTSIDFALEIVKMLLGSSQAEKVRSELVYK